MSEDLKDARRRVPAKIDRLPPSSVEAEQGVLGCILLSPDSCLAEAKEKLLMGPEVFYDLRHQTLYEELLVMYDEGRGIDLITLQQRLKDKGKLEGVGGLAYLVSLPDLAPSAAGIDYYIEIIREKYLLRKMIQACTSTVGNVFENESDPHGLVREFEKMARLIGDEAIRLGGEVRKTTSAFAQAAIDDWTWAAEHPGEYSGIPCGLKDVDEVTWGWQKQELTVIGGRPSSGKSALVIGFAGHAAVNLKKPTLIFSLETAGKAIIKRLACQRAQVSSLKFRCGRANKSEIEAVTVQMDRIMKAPLWIIDTKKLRIGQVAALTRQYKEKQRHRGGWSVKHRGDCRTARLHQQRLRELPMGNWTNHRKRGRRVL